MLVRADSSASAGRRFGHNDKQRARAETRGRSRELIAGGRHERQIVLALANDRMFLAAGTVGCRPSACASPTLPTHVGHNHRGFSCRQHARCRLAGDCRSAEPELGPTSPGSQSSGCRRQHRLANCSRLSARWIHAVYAGPVHLHVACQVQRPICQSSCRVTLPRSSSRPKIPCSL